MAKGGAQHPKKAPACRPWTTTQHICFAIRSTLPASLRCSLVDFSNVAFDETNFPSVALASSTPARALCAYLSARNEAFGHDRRAYWQGRALDRGHWLH